MERWHIPEEEVIFREGRNHTPHLHDLILQVMTQKRLKLELYKVANLKSSH